jgi:peptidoglycan/LPS O-acetylase OafA/YrhL
MMQRQAPLEIPSLDGIRAFSFLIVFLAHAGLAEIVPGGLGVTVFFFLSGYLITTLMRDELSKTGSTSLSHFYLRRALRILPPFYLVLTLGVILSVLGVLDGPPSISAVRAQALHYINYWLVWRGYQGQVPGMAVYWSLAVEEHFYLLFPAIFAVLHRKLGTPTQRVLVLWSICALVLVWRCVLVTAFETSTDRTYLATDTRLDSILYGCALALVGNPALDPERPGGRTLWLGVLLPAGLSLMLFSLLYREPAFRETFRYSLQGISLYPIFVCAIRYPTFGPFKILNLPWVRHVGVLSYSLYLTHHAVIYGIERWVHILPLFQGLLSFAVALAVAEGIWRTVERPCAKLRKRLAYSMEGVAPSGGQSAPEGQLKSHESV